MSFEAICGRVTSNDYDSSQLVFGSSELKHEDTKKEAQSLIENTTGMWSIELGVGGRGITHSMIVLP